MMIFETVKKFQEWRESLPPSKVGFVPTMGALHSGHESLIKFSVHDNDFTVLSIFVNPTQFNNSEDLKNYPNTFEQDLMMAEKLGVDAVFAPKDMNELYPDNYRFKMAESQFSNELCGAHRPGHFDGVLTVVMKLFLVAKPARAYFGEKDHQQLTLIKDMVSSFFLPLEVIGCPTVREISGLALSSRNVRLTPQEIEIAPKLYHTISHVKDKSEAIKTLSEFGFKIDYLEDLSHRRYVAATLGSVRLIDNVEL
jgi:pantoate--beta-alanine ligase